MAERRERATCIPLEFDLEYYPRRDIIEKLTLRGIFMFKFSSKGTPLGAFSPYCISPSQYEEETLRFPFSDVKA